MREPTELRVKGRLSFHDTPDEERSLCETWVITHWRLDVAVLKLRAQCSVSHCLHWWRTLESLQRSTGHIWSWPEIQAAIEHTDSPFCHILENTGAACIPYYTIVYTLDLLLWISPIILLAHVYWRNILLIITQYILEQTTNTAAKQLSIHLHIILRLSTQQHTITVVLRVK